jgi:hypothetical protein
MIAVTRVAGVVVVAVLLVAACSDGSGEREDAAAVVMVNEAQRGGGGWSALAIQAEYVEAYDTLAEMGMKADVVVIAQATGVDGVRRRGPEGLAGSALAQIRFEVIRAISDWDADSVVVEFDEVMSLTALEEQVVGFPPAVLVLREKGTKEEAGFYRLVNSQGLWTEQPDGGLFAPLFGFPFDGTYASELGEMKGLEDLGDHLEAARRECDPECGRGPRPEGE